MGIRIIGAKNFKGNPYATEKFVRDLIGLENEQTLIDKSTGKINPSFIDGFGLAIKPFGFNIDDAVDNGNGNFIINIPGIVFSIVNDNLGAVLCDYHYNNDGSTNIIFSHSDKNDVGENKTFTVYSFTNIDGLKLNILEKTELR